MLKDKIINIYKQNVFTRCDDTGSIYYFSHKDFKDLKFEDYEFLSSKGYVLKGKIYYYDNLFKKDYPILLVGGSDDMVSNRGKKLIDLKDYYAKQSDKVSYKIYENDRHEILNEDDRDVVIKDIVDWLKNIL